MVTTVSHPFCTTQSSSLHLNLSFQNWQAWREDGGSVVGQIPFSKPWFWRQEMEGFRAAQVQLGDVPQNADEMDPNGNLMQFEWLFK